LATKEEARAVAAADVEESRAATAAGAIAATKDDASEDGEEKSDRAGPGSDEEDAVSTSDAPRKKSGVDADAAKEESYYEEDNVADFFAEAGIVRNHIFITSPPGVGKTTMVQRLLAMLREEEGEDGVKVAGFYTEEVRDRTGQRAGFDVVRVGRYAEEQERVAIARMGQAQPKVGKYTIDVAAFEPFALSTLATPPKPARRPKNARTYTASDGSQEIVALLEENLPTPPWAKPVKEKKEYEPFIASSTWQGKKRRYFFGRGWQGQGYYLDPEQEDDDEDDDDSVTGDEGSAAEKDNDDWCRIFMPSENVEAMVEASNLQRLPEGWQDPRQKEVDERRKNPHLCVCDEVGKMELLSLKFGPAFLNALDDGGFVILGTLPLPAKGQRDHEVVEQVKRRADIKLFRITRNNRDSFLPKAYADLRESLGLGPPGSETRKKQREEERKQKAEEEAKMKAEMEAKRRKELKELRKKSAKRAERRERQEKIAMVREKIAKQAREERKLRAEVAKRAKAFSKSGPLEVEEGDDLEVHEEVALEESDGSSIVADCCDGVADVDSEASELEEVRAVLDVDGMKLPKAAPKGTAAPKGAAKGATAPKGAAAPRLAPTVPKAPKQGAAPPRQPAAQPVKPKVRRAAGGVARKTGGMVLLEDDDEVL